MKDKEHEYRVKKGIQTGMVSLIVNIFLILMKLTAGLKAGSVAILADAMNSIMDSVGALLTIGGFLISKKPADEEHPYGHQRAEYISGLFISILILFVGFEFLISSIKKIWIPSSVATSKLVLLLLFSSVIIKIALGYYYKKSFNSESSAIISALIKDSFSDAMMTSAIIISYFLEIRFNWYIDGYVGVVIAGFILYSGITSIIETSNELLGPRPDSILVENMQKLLNSYDSIHGYHDLIVHIYGPNKIFVTVDIEIDSNLTLIEAHSILDKIERDFERKFNIKTVAHLDPITLNDPRYLNILKRIKKILVLIDKDFTIHDLQVNNTDKDKIIRFDLVIPDHIKMSDNELFDLIIANLDDELKKYRIKIEFDRYYILSDTN